jgi:hypothetical protein
VFYHCALSGLNRLNAGALSRNSPAEKGARHLLAKRAVVARRHPATQSPRAAGDHNHPHDRLPVGNGLNPDAAMSRERSSVMPMPAASPREESRIAHAAAAKNAAVANGLKVHGDEQAAISSVCSQAHGLVLSGQTSGPATALTPRPERSQVIARRIVYIRPPSLRIWHDGSFDNVISPAG